MSKSFLVASEEQLIADDISVDSHSGAMNRSAVFGRYQRAASLISFVSRSLDEAEVQVN